MWNKFNTADYSGMIAETIMIPNGEHPVRAYYSRPLGAGPYPGLVLIPHMPGWDEIMREFARRFTEHGYEVVLPNIYEEYGHGTPSEVIGRMRSTETGFVDDHTVVEDVEASLGFLKNQIHSNGKAGVIGMCSGGRHTFLCACQSDNVDAAVDCWGGGVFDARGMEAPSAYAENLNCPLLGIFGNDDKHPSPEEVDKLEEILKELNKDVEFYRYDGAGHGIWYYDKPMYRQPQAMESLDICLEWLDKHLK